MSKAMSASKPRTGAGANVVEVTDYTLQGEGIYTGQVHADTLVPHGSGRMSYSQQSSSDNGDLECYEGQWYWGSWHGPNGMLQFRNGDTYIGSFEQNTRHGQGLYMWADGRSYEGDFQQNQRHGRGKFSFADGAIYEGEFVQGRRHGQGKYSFPNGSSYEGQWKDSHYDGFGVFKWTDGRVYQGEWRMSQHHGRGVKHDCYGQVVFDGLWVNHKPAEDFRKQPSPASGTTAFPQEIRICNTPSDHNFSAQGASFVQQPRLRRTVTPPSPPSPSYVQSERSRPLILDSNFDSRPKQVCCYEIHKGISRTQETFRFAPASAGRKTAPKPQGYWADTVICPPQLRTHQVSGGEKPATTPIEGLSHISTLIRDQQRALEKYNENHHRQKQTKHVPYTNTVVRR